MVEQGTKREIDQLIQVAKYYLSESERVHSCDPDVSNIVISDVTGGHVLGQLKCEEVLLAHLASCAIRLCTVWEIRKEDFPLDYRKKFYKKDKSRKEAYTQEKIITEITNNLNDHIHFLLRDNVGHEENDLHIAIDRITILEKLTIGETFLVLNSCMRKTVSTIDCLINLGQITL